VAEETYSPDDTLDVGGGRRLSLSPEALLVEIRRGRDAWILSRAIPYDEIRAVYHYEARDWSYLAVAGAYWLGALLLVLVAAAVIRFSTLLLAGSILVVTFLIGGLAVYRVLTVPRPLLRLDAYGGTLVVPGRGTGFFRRLTGRLPKPGEQRDLLETPEQA
jgi:hypothetical protein